jgi:hypothetical protein
MAIYRRVAGDATKMETAGDGPAKPLFYPRAGAKDIKLFFERRHAALRHQEIIL